MKVYISGPITGVSNYLERFAEAEQTLTNKGYSTVNPAKIGHQLPTDTTYDQYMQMCDVYYINWDTEELGICIEGACTMVPIESIVVMQCTGLPDKKGKRIFEGDIVQVKHDIFNVAWDQTFCHWGLFKNDICCFNLATYRKDMTVIGNIHTKLDW